ncbi:MAG: hypothetical protein WBE48_23775, partial [Xanthobacteraceae bacterium]
HFVSSATVLPVVALPITVASACTLPLVAAASIDPIFEKIQKLKTACDRLNASDEPMENSNPKHVEMVELMCEAEMDLVSTPPLTRAGATATLRAYLDYNEACELEDERARLLLENLHDYLKSSLA